MILFAFVAAVVLLLALAFLLFSGVRHSDKSFQNLDFDNLLPRHCQHFTQLAQALRDEDEEFVSRRVPRKLLHQWRQERRHILSLYVRNLREDFLNLQRLARILAALSPEVQKRREWDWLRMEIQFRILYRGLALKILFRNLEPDELADLANLIGGFAAQMQSRMSSLSHPESSHVQIGLEG